MPIRRDSKGRFSSDGGAASSSAPKGKRAQAASIESRAAKSKMSTSQVKRTIRIVNSNRNAAKSNPIPKAGAFSRGQYSHLKKNTGTKRG